MNNRVQEMIINKNIKRTNDGEVSNMDLMLEEIFERLDLVRKGIGNSDKTKQILEIIRSMVPLTDCSIRDKKIVISNRRDLITMDYLPLKEHNIGPTEMVNSPQGKYIFELIRKRLLKEGNYYAFLRGVYLEEFVKQIYVSERSILATEIQLFLSEVDRLNTYEIDCKGEEDTIQNAYGRIMRCPKYCPNNITPHESYVKIIRRNENFKKTK